MIQKFLTGFHTTGILRGLIDMALPLAVIFLAMFFHMRSPVFFSYNNLIAITVQVSAMMVIAIWKKAES